ncbi:MAG: hypothetical protein NC218_02495 [Acetobacter sp.]|nr:hypothetical protein [Acetobacter sp.]
MAKTKMGGDDFQKEELDLSTIPAIVTFVNNGKVRKTISISGQNQSLPIEAGQTIKLLADSTSELIGYLSQENEELEVTFAAKA